MKNQIFTSLFLICVGFIPVSSFAQTLAFPTAQGYGKYTTGGRGGDVVEVTTLEDYDPATEEPISGSFRWAFTQAKDSSVNKWGVWVYTWKPITIVFKVGGVIDLKADFGMNRDNVTIAGQTAPGDGICFKRHTLKFGGRNNAIVRYIRSRPGDEAGAETSAARWENGGNFIFDHCSFSWGIEETTHFSHANDFTIQWCIISEALYSSIHKKGNRGYAAQWGGQYASYHHNLLAHNQSRSPRFNGAYESDIYGLIDYRNNVKYNWGSYGACYGGEWNTMGGRGFAHMNYVNSYDKPGPGTDSRLYFARPSYDRGVGGFVGYAKWFFNGNTMDGSQSITEENWLGVETSQVGGKENIYSGEEFVRDDEVSSNGTLEDYASYTETSPNAYQSVLDNVGAIYPKRDGIDIRLIGEVSGEIPVYRSIYVHDDTIITPKRGVQSGIIDTPKNLKPENAGDDWDPWYSYYTATNINNALIDSDHDGMPDEWETQNGLNPNDPEDRNKVTQSGYTALEVYLNGLVGEYIPLDFNPSAIDDIQAGSDISVIAYQNRLVINAGSSVTNGVEILNTAGMTVNRIQSQNIGSVDISNLSKGVYIAKIMTDTNKQIVRKFIK